MGKARSLPGTAMMWWGAATILLAATFVLPVYLMKGKSVTSDEVAHLPAGYSYLKTGFVRLNPMHPPLVKELCAFPLLFMDLDMPVGDDVLARPDLPLTYQWTFGRRFLDRPDLDHILFWGRLPAVLLSFGLAVLVLVWSRRLWGNGGALLSVFLYAFDPTITAHAQLVTTDVGVAFFSTLFLFVLRAYLLRPSRPRLVLSGLTLGLALGAKFSAIFLLPISLGLLGIEAWPDPQDSSVARRLERLLGAIVRFLVIAGIGCIVVWAIYFFPADPLFYFRGLRTVNADHVAEHALFLMGDFDFHGWWYYFLVAWLVKTPIPILILLAVAVALFTRGVRAGNVDEAFVLIPAVALFAAYSAFSDALGVRYLIPCFPFLFIFTGRVVPAVVRSARWKPALAGLLAWVFLEYASIWPDQLSYFNQIAGGPTGGTLWLDDSNVDWGQGMIQLREYVEERRLSRYRMCALEHIDWSRYGILGEPIGFPDVVSSPPKGTLILSAHCLARARGWLERLHGEGEKNWLAHAEPSAVVGHAYYVYDFRSGS